MADKRDVRSALRAYEQPSMLQGAWDEISGAFARYGRRSGAQRDASLAMLNQAVDPNTDPLTGAGMKALGLAGLVTHPLAFFPTGDEWRERTRNAGNTGRMGQAIGGMLGDLPGLIDPQLLAGGGVLAAAPLVGKLARQGKTLSHSELLARGADGHLSSAREMQIPVSKVVGREPTPAAAEGMPYVKGRPITQPIEVEYNAADDTYTLYAGNHRITQAELNGDEFIPAFVQGNGGKFGGSPSAVSREQALESMVDQPQRRQITTQSYKETLPDGTERWVPGTLRSNPTTAPRFEPSMSIADIRRYIEQFGEPPPPRAKGELVTGKRKDVYPDGTVAPVPGLLRTKRPPSLGEALQGLVGGGDEGFTVFHGTGKYEADKIKEGGFKIFGESGAPDQFELPGISTTPNRSTAQFYAGGENYLTEADRMDPFVMELRVSGSKALYPKLGRAEKEFEDAGGKISDIPAFLQFLKSKGYKGVTHDGEVRVFDPADIQVVGGQPMRYGDNGLED